MPARTLVVSLLAVSSLALAQQPKTVTEDKDWAAQSATLKNSLEAEVIVRVGDVDNLGFGWPDGFDPFCGRMSESHGYPWDVNEKDLPGFDRILMSAKYDPAAQHDCSTDGYSGSFDPKRSKPVPYRVPTSAVKGTAISNASLQFFIDDFQARVLCARYQVSINGKRFAEFEKLINAIEQTGPVGKLITVPLPEEFFGELSSGKDLVVTIDEVTGAGDGYAIDFVRLLINRKRQNTCRGTVRGQVLEKDTEATIANARVSLADKSSVLTDAEGRFVLKDIPTGFEVLTASATGYSDGTGTADVGQGDENAEVQLHLEKGKELVFDRKKISVGQAFSLNSILFDQGKAVLKKESMPELEKVVQFMKDNATAEIELSGHTSSEGDPQGNRSLSYRRVKACKDYVTAKGIDAGRIVAVGYGPDRPVASNDTEPNRRLNRRVELRVVKN